LEWPLARFVEATSRPQGPLRPRDDHLDPSASVTRISIGVSVVRETAIPKRQCVPVPATRPTGPGHRPTASPSQLRQQTVSGARLSTRAQRWHCFLDVRYASSHTTGYRQTNALYCKLTRMHRQGRTPPRRASRSSTDQALRLRAVADPRSNTGQQSMATVDGFHGPHQPAIGFDSGPFDSRKRRS